MKYKAGDKVKIKTKEEWDIKFPHHYSHNLFLSVEKDLKKIGCGRVVLIKECYEHNTWGKYYIMDGSEHKWDECMVKCLVEKYREPVPIYDRWEILDL